jgi:hypothetical protein
MQSSRTDVPATWKAVSLASHGKLNALLASLAEIRHSAQWDETRRGLLLMSGSMTAFVFFVLLAALSGFGLSKALESSRLAPVYYALALNGALGIGLSGVGYLAGVVLSLLAPRQTRLQAWVAVHVVGLFVCPALLLVSLASCEDSLFLPTPTTTAQVLAGLGGLALLVSLFAYCCYLAGVARFLGARRLARDFLAFYVGLVVEVALTGLALGGAGPRLVQRLLPFAQSKLEIGMAIVVWAYAGLLFVALAVAWFVLLWRLRRLLPGRSAS